MVGESNRNVFFTQIDASSHAEFELSEFDISRFDCIFVLASLRVVNKAALDAGSYSVWNAGPSPCLTLVQLKWI